MRNLFPFYGIKKPKRVLIEKECFALYPVTHEQELFELLKELWNQPEREYQMTACNLAYQYKNLWTPSFLFTLEELIRTKSWWDSVDTLASKMVGTLLLMYPTLQKQMDDWIADSDFWIRRSALIHQLSYKEATDEKRLFKHCTRTMEEKEFFIRKAIGWALRQYARTNPQAVRTFLAQHKSSLSPLSYREAGKYCLNQL